MRNVRDLSSSMAHPSYNDRTENYKCKRFYEVRGNKKERKKRITSHAGNRTPATAVRAPDPNH